MRTHRRRWAALGLLTVVLGPVLVGVLLTPAASAHPLDETVQQAYLTPAASGLTVRLDISPNVLVAPAFAAGIDPDGDRVLCPVESAAHTAAVGRALSVQVDGRDLALRPLEQRYPPLDLLAAGGGTITLVWTTDLPSDARRLRFTDAYAPGRTIVQAAVLQPADPVPVGNIGHADDGRTLTAGLHDAAVPQAPTTVAPAPPTDTAGTTGSTATGSTLLDALRRPLTSPWALATLVAACVLLGALHALTPGHGKALLASYLVGGRGTPRQATQLGLTITVTHTASVIVLGLAVLLAGRWLLPDVVVPVLTVAAGGLVAVLGLRLVRRRWRTRDQPHDHDQHHGDGQVHGAHEHEHGGVLSVRVRSPVATAAPARARWSRSTTAMGVAAGLVPCPEALGVLLLAIGLHRTALGLAMIVAFSIGLAAVLVGLGLLLVTRPPVLVRLADRIPARLTAGLGARLPLLSAVVVAVLGLVMTAGGIGALLG